MARKKITRKKPIVNIDSRVSKKIREEKVSRIKGKPKTDYSRKEILEYAKKEYPKREVVSSSKFKRMSATRQDKAVNYSEVEREYKDKRQNWYGRYERVEGTAYKKTVPGVRTNKVTGEKEYKERTRTFYRWRDKYTGRFVSYTGTKIIRDKKTGELVHVPIPTKDKPVKQAREEMRKELAIHKMAEKKRISVEDARAIYAEFEDEGMERYLHREYARTP